MKEVIELIINKPWPWWVGGPLIGLFVLTLLVVERKQLGISSSYQYICARVSPFRFSYFNQSEKNSWQFYFVIGLVLGGVGLYYLNSAYDVQIAEATVDQLQLMGVSQQAGFVPTELFNFDGFSVLILLIGGILLGFGARYANGCTAGHAIMGCAQLAPASIISTVCFFIGGLIAAHFILPIIL